MPAIAYWSATRVAYVQRQAWRPFGLTQLSIRFARFEPIPFDRWAQHRSGSVRSSRGPDRFANWHTAHGLIWEGTAHTRAHTHARPHMYIRAHIHAHTRTRTRPHARLVIFSSRTFGPQPCRNLPFFLYIDFGRRRGREGYGYFLGKLGSKSDYGSIVTAPEKKSARSFCLELFYRALLNQWIPKNF